MRLKLRNLSTSVVVLNILMTMNQKNLNYEIETISRIALSPRITITMNQKNLNYEIETVVWVETIGGIGFLNTMNQKNLNYEIETYSLLNLQGRSG